MMLPLLQSADPERPILWARGRVLSARALMERVARVAAALPARGRHLINLCERRDDFLIAFCAALVRGHTNLLPSSRAAGVVEEVAALDPDSYRCDDELVAEAGARADADPELRGVDCACALPSEHVAVKAFTSGSTGTPQGHVKLWRSFAGSTAQNALRIRECLAPAHGDARPWIVATVPPQHMYGLETSIILPLLSDMAVHAGRPLFPADIAAALAEVPEPRVLVTTPVHMRAIAASGQAFPRTALVVSATAPLDVDLAQVIERQLDTTVLEMFGSTETCVIASRRTASEREWHLYPGVTLAPDAAGASVNAPWFVAPMRLQDLIELRPDNRFTISGRNADMIEVAGKRASLADLTRRVLAIPGVHDAVVFQPDASASGVVRRVAALVVAPSLSADAITEQLARTVDPAFIPRPLVMVPSLPRNEVGKLPRAQLLAALHAEK
ncbi:MAG TPA: AMP-binding protein [Steroidobacteraceae bacterium]|nr:AMP-binding protein [Steroidobacteraceae bacterium]